MATKRMFSKTITNSSRFLMMPESSQNLYFHLGMNADDDGFVEHFSIMRMVGSKPDDLKILALKGFVRVFDDSVLVIVDWKENNLIRSDRYTPSKYLEIYKEELKQIPQSLDTIGIPDDNQMGDADKDRLGKDSKIPIAETSSEDLEKKTEYTEDFEQFYKIFPSRRKGGKKSPWGKWKAMTTNERTLALADVQERTVKHWDWLKDDGNYIPAPEVYLNKQQWLMPIVSAPASKERPQAKVDRFTK